MLRAEDPLAQGQQRGVLVPGGGRVPRLPGPPGELVPGVQGVRVLRAEDPLEHGQQRGELVPGGGRVPGLPGPPGELRPVVEGVRVLRAEDPLEHGQQRGEQVPGGGRVPRLPGPPGEVRAGGQGVWVLRTEDPFPCVKYSPLEISGRGVTAAPSEVIRDSGHPSAVIGKSRLGVRQQRRACRPGPGRGTYRGVLRPRSGRRRPAAIS